MVEMDGFPEDITKQERFLNKRDDVWIWQVDQQMLLPISEFPIQR